MFSFQPIFLYLPYHAVHGPMQVPEQYKKPFKHKIKNKERLSLAGMVSCLDEAIANVTQTLKETGLYNNTIMIFSTGKNMKLTNNLKIQTQKFQTIYPNRVKYNYILAKQQM